MNHTKRLLAILAIALVSGVAAWLALDAGPGEDPGSDGAPVAAPGAFGHVIDAATEAPIEGIIVTIGKRDDLTEVSADELGALHFDASLGRQRFGLQLTSGAPVSFGKKRRKVTPEDLSLVLRAKIGPLYRIEIVGPEEVQGLKWSAHLEQRSAGGGPPPGGSGPTSPQPLSPGSPHEVRFPAPLSAAENTTAYLALHEPSGVWRGEVIAPTLVGEHPDVIQAVVSKFGILRGRVVEPPETPLTRATVHPMGAEGLLWPPIEGPWTHASTAESGTFEFQGLVPGDYFLMIAPPHFPMIQQRLTIPEGGLDIGDIAVPGGGAKGEFSGALKSATGRGSMCAMLLIESTDGTGWASATVVGTPGELLQLFFNGEDCHIVVSMLY